MILDLESLGTCTLTNNGGIDMRFKTQKMFLVVSVVILVTLIALGIATARSNQASFSLTSPASFPVDI